jgi:hypothetical protein
MDPIKTKWQPRATAYVAAVVVGLSVVLGAAFALDMWETEPGESVVLLVLGTASVVAAFLGRVTYRGVISLLGDTPNSRA